MRCVSAVLSFVYAWEVTFNSIQQERLERILPTTGMNMQQHSYTSNIATEISAEWKIKKLCGFAHLLNFIQNIYTHIHTHTHTHTHTHMYEPQKTHTHKNCKFEPSHSYFNAQLILLKQTFVLCYTCLQKDF